MKNKKGFTLVEMLVVLGIICVLALIITPVIISYRNKANNEYNDKLKDNVITVAKDYYTNNRSELPNGYPEGKYATLVTLDKLKQNNLFSNDVIDAYKNNCSSESYVVVENNRGNYNYYACLKCGDKT
ncbi:MAG: type II secretion system protein, partial [Bacilli bacterium]|nr:type II secretion system protein [Bacilli bacterium]